MWRYLQERARLLKLGTLDIGRGRGGPGFGARFSAFVCLLPISKSPGSPFSYCPLPCVALEYMSEISNPWAFGPFKQSSRHASPVRHIVQSGLGAGAAAHVRQQQSGDVQGSLALLILCPSCPCRARASLGSPSRPKAKIAPRLNFESTLLGAPRRRLSTAGCAPTCCERSRRSTRWTTLR